MVGAPPGIAHMAAGALIRTVGAWPSHGQRLNTSGTSLFKAKSISCIFQADTSDDSTEREGTIRNITTVQLEVVNYKQTFTWPKFFQAFFLGLILSVWDSFSDFFFASSVESVCEKDDMDSICGGLPGSYVQGFTYVFIGLPGAIMAISGLHNLLHNWMFAHCGQGRCMRVAIRLVDSTTLLGVGYGGVRIIMLAVRVPMVGFYPAILTTVVTLGIKVVALFVHGPQMKRLVSRFSGMFCAGGVDGSSREPV